MMVAGLMLCRPMDVSRCIQIGSMPGSYSLEGAHDQIALRSMEEGKLRGAQVGVSRFHLTLVDFEYGAE